MLKVVFVYERQQSELLPRLLELLFNSQRGMTGNGKDVLALLNRESPKLAFFEFEKPSNLEGELNNFLKNLDENIRLRISFIKISPSNFFLFKIIREKILSSMKDRFSHHGKGRGIKEAFVKR